ncbi:hypothetical protein DFR76_109477 [Nocardia pseudobrasiliensis]|uniref:Uncharacterized protein n=1 Tax=Nocardia pseudobrasiliensis TaxID=45979 RepID=A0A370I054_9NOCA|nr:hypothetical protein DFR76_109477 [Nocardia pseudobrasiliensis]
MPTPSPTASTAISVMPSAENTPVSTLNNPSVVATAAPATIIGTNAATETPSPASSTRIATGTAINSILKASWASDSSTAVPNADGPTR